MAVKKEHPAVLFHEKPLLNRKTLRTYARKQVQTSRLIQNCVAGSLPHARALMRGFWPFVFEFQDLIKEKLVGLDPSVLQARYGGAYTNKRLRLIVGELKEMAREEGDHAELWRAGASELGLSDYELAAARRLACVEKLLTVARLYPTHLLFSHLAGTEYIAEELSLYTTKTCGEKFLALFPSRKWAWGDAHLLPHSGPSHLEIDEDLARAFHPETDPDMVRMDLEAAVKKTARMFYLAAEEVFGSPLFLQ